VATGRPSALYRNAKARFCFMFRTVASESSRARDAAQIAFHERHLFARHSDVRAGAHRDADIRGRQRRRVVDPVARHRDTPPLGLETHYKFRLVLRPEFAVHLIDAELTPDGLGGGASIAGRRHDQGVDGVQALDRFRVTEQHSRLRGPPDCDHDRHRCGEP
jgi:hypothetical protein